MGLLSIITFLPLIGALIVALMPKDRSKEIKAAALLTTVVTFGVSLLLFKGFNPNTFHFQFVEAKTWVPSMGIQYKLGLDGISLWLVVLTTFLTVIATWFSQYIGQRVKEYMIFMLLLETAMLGVFVSLDLVLFYTFFEASLIPMYFLINIWGGARRRYAAVKFFIFTFAGSIFMLVGIITISQLMKRYTGQMSFDIVAIQEQAALGRLWAGAFQLEAWVFWAFTIAFMVKCPMFPFHTWLPDAHVEAPTAGSVILAGVLLKMGTYGFLRFCIPLFPEVASYAAPVIVGLAVVGIIYGAIVAAVQPDVKKLVAYSSVAHMGFVMLGIFSFTHTGMMGGALQQLNHGVSTGALFLLIGLIYERRHTREFKEFGGLKAQMPIFATIFLIVMLSSVGLPATNGFIGEFLALLGVFQASYAGFLNLNVVYAGIAGVGVILAAVYLLVMYQKMFYGPNDNPANQRLKDLKGWEVAMCGSLVVLIFWGGLFPNSFMKPMEASIGAMRLMSLANPGERPSWANPSHEIDAQMNLVSNGKIVAPAQLHPQPVVPEPEAGVVAQR